MEVTQFGSDWFYVEEDARRQPEYLSFRYRLKQEDPHPQWRHHAGASVKQVPASQGIVEARFGC